MPLFKVVVSVEREAIGYVRAATEREAEYMARMDADDILRDGGGDDSPNVYVDGEVTEASARQDNYPLSGVAYGNNPDQLSCAEVLAEPPPEYDLPGQRTMFGIPPKVPPRKVAVL